MAKTLGVSCKKAQAKLAKSKIPKEVKTLILKIITRRGFTSQNHSDNKKRMKKYFQIIILILGFLLAFTTYKNAFAAEPSIIYIKAVSPGYTIDGKQNVGEMIEIARKDHSNTPISLAGLIIGYTNSSGNSTDLLEFPEDSWLTGESILLRYSGSPENEPAHLTYLKTLAFKAGPLELRLEGKTIDSVCWTGKDGCAPYFVGAKPTILVRDESTWEFSHVETYEPNFDPSSFEQKEEAPPEKVCEGIEFSEVLTYFETDKFEQFIELFNPKAESVKLDGCNLKYKNKLYPLSGRIPEDGYYIYAPTDFSLTKNPTNINLLEIIDADGAVVDKLEIPSGQKKAASYAFIGHDESGAEIWRTTYAVTPLLPNIFQEYKNCEEGKAINTQTGNCVKIVEIEEKTCPEGYLLNPATNRCKKIIKNDGEDYPLVPKTYKEESSFTALVAVIVIAVIGAVYVVFQFRKELKRLFGKVFRSFRKKQRHDSDHH